MSNDLKKIFGQRIKEAREKVGMTQLQLAKTVQVSAASISAYEKGNSFPSLTVAKDIATECKVTIDWLCGQESSDINLSKTLSDVIELLFKLDNPPLFEIRYKRQDERLGETFYTDEEVGLYFNDRYSGFVSSNQENRKLFDFFKDWQKMRDLYNRNSIDNEVYHLWMEKTLKKYSNVAIPDSCDIPF